MPFFLRARPIFRRGRAIPGEPQSKTLVADAGSYAISGQDVGLYPSLEAGSYVVTGMAALMAATMSSDAGAYALSGQDVLFNVAMAAGAGSYVVTGQAALFLGVVSVDAGVYLIGGQDVALNTVMVASEGAYVLTGQDATLRLLTEFTGNRSPLYIAKSGATPASRWRGVPPR